MVHGFVAVTIVTMPSCGHRRRARRTFTFEHATRVLLDLGSAVALLGSIAGSIYHGRATPTDKAAVGEAGASGIAAASGGIGLDMLRLRLLGTVEITR